MDSKLSRRSFGLVLGGVGVTSLLGGAATYGRFSDEHEATTTFSAANHFSYPIGLNLGANTPETYTAGFGTTFGGDVAPDRGSATQRHTTEPIDDTSDPTLYRSYRWGADFGYDFSVDSGTYQVVLYFAERYWEADGQRIFDVSVDGTEVVSNLDIHAEVGHDTALVEVVPNVTPDGDTIAVDFSSTDSGDVDNAIVGAIEIAHWPLREVPSQGRIEHSGKVVSVDGDSTADGANVVQRSYSGRASQRWTPIQNADGSYRFENDNSGNVLAVAGGGTAQGDSVVQQTWEGDDHQQWEVVENGDDTYRLVNVNSGLVADVEGAANANGANVIQWAWNGGDNQRWSFPSI